MCENVTIKWVTSEPNEHTARKRNKVLVCEVVPSMKRMLTSLLVGLKEFRKKLQPRTM